MKIKSWKMTPDNILVKGGKAFAMAGKKVLFAYMPEGGQIIREWDGLKNNVILLL